MKLSSSNISQFLDTVYARGNVDAAVREAASTMLAPFTEVAESARAWASPAVDSLAAVFGGDAIRVFRDLASWTAGMYVYIALRLSRVISSAGSRAVEDMQIALALGAGPTAPPSLRFLAATQFLELAVASIRADAGHAPMQIAGSILRELASEYAFLRGSLRSLERTKQGPRARPVDMTLPKGFPGKCGPGNHAITYQPKLLLEIERCEDEKRLASIVSNKELYGSGSVSMFTAAQEIRRLLHLGPLTKGVWRAIPEDAAVLLSASVHYFPHSSGGDDVKSSPGSRVEFGKTKHQQRCSCCARKIHYIRFEKRHLLCALERPDIVRVLFSPHYNRSGKGLTLALVKIKLSVYPSSRLLRSGSTKSLDYLRKMIECHNNNQKQNRSRHRFFEGQVLFR